MVVVVGEPKKRGEGGGFRGVLGGWVLTSFFVAEEEEEEED